MFDLFAVPDQLPASRGPPQPATDTGLIQRRARPLAKPAENQQRPQQQQPAASSKHYPSSSSLPPPSSSSSHLQQLPPSSVPPSSASVDRQLLSLSLLLFTPFFIVIFGGSSTSNPSLAPICVIGTMLSNLMDAANSRDLSVTVLWLTTLVMIVVTLFFSNAGDDISSTSLHNHHHHHQSLSLTTQVLSSSLFSIVHRLLTTLLILSVCFLLTLQFKWMALHSPGSGRLAERLLVAITPSIFAGSLTCISISSGLFEGTGGLSPPLHLRLGPSSLFGLLYSLALSLVSRWRTIHFDLAPHYRGAAPSKLPPPPFILPPSLELLNFCAAVLSPPLVRAIASFRNLLPGKETGGGAAADLALSLSFHLIVAQLLIRSKRLELRRICMGNTQLYSILNLLLSSPVPIVATLLSLNSLSLLPDVNHIVEHFGGAAPHTTSMSQLLLVCTALCYVSCHHIITTSAFGPQYSDPLAQLLLVLGGVLLSLLVGIPLSISPLVCLQHLGIGLFLGTRKARFMAVAAAITTAGLCVCAWRRVGFLQVRFHDGLSLANFCFCAAGAGGLAMLSAGFLYRNQRYGEGGAKKAAAFTMSGVCFSLYAVALAAIESVLSGERKFSHLSHIHAYPSYLLLATSAIMTLASFHLFNQSALSSMSCLVAVAASIGKLFVLLECGDSSVTTMVVGGAVLVFTLGLPFTWSDRIVYLRDADALRNPALTLEVPAALRPRVLCYTFVALPSVIFLFARAAISSLASTFGSFGGYTEINPVSFFGLGLSLWSSSTLCALSFLFPITGASVWKSRCLIGVIIGFGIYLLANVGASSSRLELYALSNSGYGAYGLLASLFGGKGIFGIVVVLGTLIGAASGVLDPRSTGSSDKSRSARMIMFNASLGCGVGLLATFVCVEGGGAVFMCATIVCSSMVSFFFSFAVLSVLLQSKTAKREENLGELTVVCNRALIASPVLCITEAIAAEMSSFHAVSGGDGCMVVLGLIAVGALSVSFALKWSMGMVGGGINGFEERVSLRNRCIFTAWLSSIAIVYSQFGMLSAGVLWVPQSVIFTFLLSIVLLDFDPSAAISLSRTEVRKKLGPALFLTALALYLASLHTILLRGNFIVDYFSSGANLHVHTSHSTMFENLYGGNAVVREHESSLKRLMTKEAVRRAAKMSAAGFWTNDVSFYSPAIHFIGSAAIAPTLYMFLKFIWGARMDAADIFLVAPLNLISIILCSGIPHLRYTGGLACAMAGIATLALFQEDEANLRKL